MAIDLRMGTEEKQNTPQKVIIKPTESGALISTYKNSTTQGYVTLHSEEINAYGNVIPNSLRSVLLRAEVTLLEKFLDRFGKEDQLPGRIVVKEFLESQIPDNYMSRLNKNLDYEDSIAPFVKRNGKDRVELTLGGERILRFTEYDATGNVKDEFIPNELIDSRPVTQRIEEIFEKTRIKPLTYEDLNLFSKRTIPSQIIQEISTSTKTEKINHGLEEKNLPRKQSFFEKSFGSVFISLVVVAYIGYIIIENDRIARMEGSSLWEQLMLLLAAIGIYAIYKTFKKR